MKGPRNGGIGPCVTTSSRLARHDAAKRRTAGESPQETSSFFAACARSAEYAATAKNSVSQRSVKTGHSYKAQRERNAQGSSHETNLPLAAGCAKDRFSKRCGWSHPG